MRETIRWSRYANKGCNSGIISDLPDNLDADLVLVVTGTNDEANYTAWATSCYTSRNTARSIFGQVHINLKYLLFDPLGF